MKWGCGEGEMTLKTFKELEERRIPDDQAQFWLGACHCNKDGCPQDCDGGIQFVMRNPVVMPLHGASEGQSVARLIFPKHAVPHLVMELLILAGPAARKQMRLQMEELMAGDAPQETVQ